jgi:hypothetical protein
MGNQIHFYMTEIDREEFLNIVQEYAPTLIALRDADVAEVNPSDESEINSGKTLALLNLQFSSGLHRKWIPEPGYFRLDTLNEPVLEYMPSFYNRWQERPGLGQGRLFGNFESHLGKPPDFFKWYESLANWIRKHYKKNPNAIGGYIGSDAEKFRAEGGYLLPNFLPPATPEWISRIGGPSE